MTTVEQPVPTAVVLESDGTSLSGLAWAWPSADLSLLVVHDLGGDLDDTRWLCEQLVPEGVSCLSVDLPGHGLSGGDLETDGASALAAAYAGLCQASPGAVGVVVEGRSAGQILAAELPSEPVAAVFIEPSPTSGHTAIHPSWRLVPKLVVVEAASPARSAYAAEIVEATNAWCLRADLGGDARRAVRSESFERQVASLTLKFALEQAAFALAERRPRGGGE